jgi:glycerate dehydrogenase
LRALGDLTVHDRSPAPEVVARAAGAGVILLNKVRLAADTFAQLPELRCVSVMATGHDVVDSAAAKARGIPVCNIPAYGTDSVAQHTIALLLELTNRVGLHAGDVHAGGWVKSPDWSYSKAPLVELAGKTLGLIGYGRIAQQTAKIAAALGMRVLAHSPSRVAGGDGTAVFAALDQVLAESDVISLHCPLNAANRELINAAAIAKMRPTAILLNTARGGLVQDQDLANALNQGRLAGAAIDVLSVEPPPETHPLFSAARCLITPHNAWATREARARLMEMSIENVRAFLAGSPRTVVNG